LTRGKTVKWHVSKRKKLKKKSKKIKKKIKKNKKNSKKPEIDT